MSRPPQGITLVLRGVRVIDPASGTDLPDRDVRIENGCLTDIDPGPVPTDLPVIDLTPRPGGEACVLCPGFIDLHAHLREPGGEEAETVASGAAAAAAGGFTTVLAMANTRPPVDTPGRVAAALDRAAGTDVRILQTAALTRGLAGGELTDIAGCAAAGAAALSDDGRNAAPAELLAGGLRQAARAGRAVLVHPEDEALIGGGGGGADVTSVERPPRAEIRAVETAISALERAGAGRLHLQHLSTAGAVELLGRARARGLEVTAEVTPHHLALPPPRLAAPDDLALAKVNPPLRDEADRAAVLAALREGIIDAIATDHAPHAPAAKRGGHDGAAPGMIGLETALPLALAAGRGAPGWLPVMVARLTTGPRRVLGAAAGDPEPRLRPGIPATCVLFDPGEEWVVGRETLRSRSCNSPLVGRAVRGRVLLTLVGGRAVHHHRIRLPATVPARA